MNNPYDLHSWSAQRRREILWEARMRNLVEQARLNRGPHWRHDARLPLVP